MTTDRRLCLGEICRCVVRLFQRVLSPDPSFGDRVAIPEGVLPGTAVQCCTAQPASWTALLSSPACWVSHGLKSYPGSEWKLEGVNDLTHSLDLTYCVVTAWCVLQKKSKILVPV